MPDVLDPLEILAKNFLFELMKLDVELISKQVVPLIT